jgi:hypothetical protein
MVFCNVRHFNVLCSITVRSCGRSTKFLSSAKRQGHLWASPSLIFRGSFTAGKVARSQSLYLLLSSVKVKNESCNTSAVPVSFHGIHTNHFTVMFAIACEEA